MDHDDNMDNQMHMGDDSGDDDNDNSNEEFDIERDSQAVIQNVMISGSEGDYSFNVEISSPDTGCDQYADWWEVFTIDSSLVYRRILSHSHVNEQPFSRSGGPIHINKDDIVVIRGHMNNLGYGSLILKGSVENGFAKDTLSISYASRLETTDPLPQDCDF